MRENNPIADAVLDVGTGSNGGSIADALYFIGDGLVKIARALAEHAAAVNGDAR